VAEDPREPDGASDQPLTDAYRLLRRVGPPDAPLDGWLARCADGRTVLLAAADALQEQHLLSVDAGAHVLGPRDVVRTGEAARFEFDWCVDRLDRVLSRRADAGAALTAGETITVAVSLRRGMAELSVTRPARDAPWPRGHWWMTDAARPVFAPDGSGPPADAATRAALETAARSCADSRVRGLIARWLESAADGPLTDASIEADLFAIAEPAPIRAEVFPPARSRSLDAAARLTEIVPADSHRQGLVGALERHIDTDISAMASDAVHSVLRRLRGRTRPRPWLMAAGAAAAVLVIGVLWPTGEDPPAQADQRRPASTSAPAAAEATAPSASPTPVAAATDLESIVSALLDARAVCGDEPACLAGVVEDPRSGFGEGAIDLDAAQRTITLLDDFGGVAVLRVDGVQSATTAQLVVIVESDGRWRLRDVHDVAQPAG
jgi:hypothetical protein